MYQFDSMTMRSGTGEMRAWITTGGAMEEMGSRAVVVDYIPAHHAVTGLGFAYWPLPSSA
jgi:protocatechuate 4,5-dioxygenase beta chain